MKKVKVIVGVVLGIAVVATLAVGGVSYYNANRESHEPVTDQIFVKALDCAVCASRVKNRLNKVEGVLENRVDMASKTVSVTYDPAKVSRKQVMAQIQDLGYNPELKPETGGLKVISYSIHFNN